MPLMHLTDHDLTCDFTVDYTYYPRFAGDDNEPPHSSYLEIHHIFLRSLDIINALTDEQLALIHHEALYLIEEDT